MLARGSVYRESRARRLRERSTYPIYQFAVAPPRENTSIPREIRTFGT